LDKGQCITVIGGKFLVRLNLAACYKPQRTTDDSKIAVRRGRMVGIPASQRPFAVYKRDADFLICAEPAQGKQA
jgi:hypothetical protein